MTSDEVQGIKFQESAQDRDVGLGRKQFRKLPKGVYDESFSRQCCYELGEVNRTHAYYNGSRKRKDTEESKLRVYSLKDKENSEDIFSFGNLVPNLWSPMQVKYDQHDYLGTSHWGPKRQSFYGYACNMTSSKDVYSKRRITAETEHLMARSGTDLKIAKLVMSSPNHPTSDIEDAFSSNFPDYIPASPNYVLALPGKTYSSSSNNSFGLVPIASPTLLLFHDDPYMKVMHAYYAKESPIPPPTIVPPSFQCY
ncbi:hypothetical protein Tco_0241102 [Tanacetum coccineum]